MYIKVDYPVVTEKGNIKAKIRNELAAEFNEAVAKVLEELGYDKVGTTLYCKALEDPDGNMLYYYVHAKSSSYDPEKFH